jgi:signal transduction histidine kinase
VYSQRKGVNFWGFPWFVLSVLLFVSIAALRIWFHHENSPQKIASDFQQKILAAQAGARKSAEALWSTKGFISDSGIKPRIESSGTESFEEPVFLFAFKNDSLVFWNNNKVILPAGFILNEARISFVLQLKNGWYGFIKIKRGDYSIVGCYLIKSRYHFQNDYLLNEFAPGFDFPPSLALTESKGSFAMYDQDKNYLVSIGFENYRPRSDGPAALMFFLFLGASLCLFCFLFRLYSAAEWFKGRENLLLALYAGTLVLLRMIHYYSGFPLEMSQSGLFSPALYSSSAFLPSLGDFALNITLLLAIVLVYYTTGIFRRKDEVPGNVKRYALATFMLGIIMVCFLATGYFLSDLVINSSIPLNLQNISGLNAGSALGIYIILALFASFWMITSRLSDALFEILPGNRVFIPAGIVTCLSVLLFHFWTWEDGGLISLFFLIYLFLFWFIRRKSKPAFSVTGMLLLLCFYSVFGTFLLNRCNKTKEREKLNILAVKLATRRNPVTEVLYEQAERKLIADTNIRRILSAGSGMLKPGPDSLSAYLKERYFNDYWQKYQVQVTVCDHLKDLRIQPQGYLVNCSKYFQEIIKEYGEATALPDLFFLDYGVGKEYYLAILSVEPEGPGKGVYPAVFIEFNLKNAYPDPGYPGLMMDKSRMDLPNLSDYSYGLYQKGRLIRAVGSIDYKMELDQYKSFTASKPVFSDDGRLHHYFRVNATDALLISKKDDDYLSLATPFPYLFILFSLVMLLIHVSLRFPGNISPVPASLRNRLNISLIGILAVTMIAIGFLQAAYIIRINAKKNVDNLREKAFSVIVEVQHKYGFLRGMNDAQKGDPDDFLVKLSNVFFTDINLFNEKGMLIASSRPQIFEEGLLSERMNAEAYRKLITEKSSIFIHNESIGTMQFNSAYLPFYNDNEELLGFVNLPYFAKQDEARKEISSFLVTFINVYIILILFGVFVTVLISNYITAPLAMLANKMSQLRLGMPNEKISWRQEDEIGELVTEYNRMIEELEKSADKLARSERESAWREMARQVAHEIKNPLTPMKLSAQYLEKAWNEKAPDWDQRLARFTKNMVEQIDALSVIATDFSDFAKMPAVVMKRIDIEEVIRFVLSLYQDGSSIRFELVSEMAKPMILADRSQVIRVFTNLVNNAVQSIEVPDKGVIEILIAREAEHIVIHVTDNGCGISTDRADKVFQPDFTTKTSGMGLGLAIVKAIVTAMNGEITFHSVEKEGTTFILKFPEDDV